MNKIFSIGVFTAAFIFSGAAVAQAGLFVEPAITYETSDASTNYPAPQGDSTGKADGLGFGARLGFHLADVVFIGIDGRYSMPEFEDADTSYSAKAVASNWGSVIGVQMPIVGLRVWGGYIWDGEMNPEASGGYDVKFTKATGYRLGAGLKLIAVSLNLEYQDLKYNNASLEQVGPFTPGTSFEDVDYKNKSWIVSVSFPLSI